MTRAGINRVLAATYQDVVSHHTLQNAAALSYYSVLAIFPSLILLSAVLAAFPLPDLFAHALGIMTQLLPFSTSRFIQGIVLSVLASRSGTWVSVGSLWLLWSSSAAFDALIEALDVAYDVKDPRAFWKTRLLAIGLALITGAFLAVVLIVMILGPRFADWLAQRIYLQHAFVLLWPFVHWGVAIGATIFAVETIYFLAPNVKQRLGATLPGAALAVASSLGLSYILGIFFRNFANYDLVYGTLGAFIVFMTWLYWIFFALLVGAELNAEVAKHSRQGALEQKISEEKQERGGLHHAA
jgi:membrane protein